MLPVAPLQLVDSFLLQYNVGQALLALFILTTLGALPLRSRKILGLNTVVFGLIFLLTPTPGPFLVITGQR